MEEKKERKKNYVLIMIGIIATIVITLGITYAYWRLTKEQTNENVVNTACLDFEITNEQNDINLPKAFPISDEDGYELTPYKFTVHNKCQDNATYQINLEMLEGSNLNTNYVKYVLNEFKEKYILEFEEHYSRSYETMEECQDELDYYKDDEDYTITKECNFEGNQYLLEYKLNYTYKEEYETNEECQSELEYYQDDGYYTVTKECVKEKVEPDYWDVNPSILGEEDDEEGYVLDNAIEGKKLTTGILESEESKDFTLRLWLDEDVKVTDDAMNKILLSKVTVSSAYLTEEMVRPTADLTLSVCNKDITALGSGEAKYDREINKYEYKIDEGEWQEGEANYEFLNQEIGRHQVSVRVTDNQNSVSKEVTKEIEITNYEPEMVEIAGKQIPITTCKNGLYKVEHNDLSELDSSWNKTEYRYAGVNYTDENSSYVHNYVEFNNEKWQIIGLVNVKTESGVKQRVKIIRIDGIEGQKDFGNYAWDISTSNWTTSKLKDMLNGIYYNSESGECYTGSNGDNASQSTCDFSTGESLPKGLDDTARKMFDSEVVWNIGGWSIAETADTMYEKERGTKTGSNNTSPAEWSKDNDETYHNGLGIMNPSDYGYAVGGNVRKTCLAGSLSNYNKNNCYKNDWLKASIGFQWLLSPSSSGLSGAFVVYADGYVNNYFYVLGAYGVLPVGYLLPSVTIYDGDGSFDNPFRLSVQ